MTEVTPIEPNRLKLIWQSDGDDRTKYCVGELVRSHRSVSLSYYRTNTDFFNAIMAGFEGFPAFPFSKVVHHENVTELFARRLPSRSRNDFFQYLAKNRLPIDTKISDFALLGYTGAFLPSDGFSFAIDWRFQDLPFLFLFEISGFRYYSGMHIKIEDMIGKAVQFIPEPENEYDPRAVAIYIENTKIGYVPRYYADEFQFWNMYYRVEGRIERIDGVLAKPQVSILVLIRSEIESRPLPMETL